MPAYLPPVTGVSYSTAMAEAVAHAPTGRAMLDTLTFSHSALGSPLRYVADYADLSANLEDGSLSIFSRSGFSVKLPEIGESASPTITATINGVSSAAGDMVGIASQGTEPVIMEHRLYASDDLSGPAVLPVLKMELISVPSITSTSLTLTAQFGDSGNRAFPRVTYNRTQYPGLVA
jgi:hypothetical protein